MVARKQNDLPVRNWPFPARPSDDPRLEKDLLFHANRHYNNFIRIARDRIEAFRNIREEFVPGITEAQQGFEQIQKEYEETNDLVKKHRKREFLASGEAPTKGRKKVEGERRGKKTREVPPDLQLKYDELKARKVALKELFDELADKFAKLIEPADIEWTRRRHTRAEQTVPVEKRAEVEERLHLELLKPKKKPKKDDTIWTKSLFNRSNLEYETLRLAAIAKVAAPRLKECINAQVLEAMLVEDWPEAWKQLKLSEDDGLRRQKEARGTCGLPPGCYNPVEAAVKQAVSTAEGLPHFRRFSQEGKIGVQLRVRFEQVIDGTCGSFRLLPAERIDRQNTPRAIRARERFGGDEKAMQRAGELACNTHREQEFFIASFRIGKKWLNFPVRLDHLPSPEVEVKWACINVWRVGGERRKHEFMLTLEGASLANPKPYGDGGTLEVRFCSQTVPDGVRVASWHAQSTGETGDVVLPTKIAERLAYPAVLRSHADTHFDEVMGVLSRYLSLAGHRPCARTWTNSEARRIGLRNLCVVWAQQIYGNERLTELWREWRAERLAANKDLFPHLGTATRWMASRGAKNSEERLAFWLFLWTLKDRHLRRTAGHQRDRSENQRNAVYRDAANSLRARFSSLLCDSIDLSVQKRRPKVEEESNEFKRLRSLRQNAAPGRCRELFKEVFGARVKSERLSDEETSVGSREPENEDVLAMEGIPDAAE